LGKRKLLKTEINDQGRATVTLNRPEIHNAFDEALITGLLEVFTGLSDNNEVRIVVLAATGKSFCAGADLNWMKRMSGYTHEQNMTDAKTLAAMLQAIAKCPKPVIGQIQGPAYGGGVGMAAVCDIAVASEKARFTLSEVKLGLTPATISPYVIAAMGQRNAHRYFLTGELFDAATALEIGLVHKVVASDDLTVTVDGFVDMMMKNSPAAMTACKELISAVANKPIDQSVLDDSAQCIADIRSTPEGKEGVAAFLEKRKPSWIEP
jgi:methylglutaconyl-CoA hydratase